MLVTSSSLLLRRSTSSRLFSRVSSPHLRFSSTTPGGGDKKQSSQILWQVGTAGAVVLAYVGITKAMSYSTSGDDDKDIDVTPGGQGDMPGTSISFDCDLRLFCVHLTNYFFSVLIF